MNTVTKIAKKVGKRIRDLRIKRGLTQEKLADLAGIDPKQLQLMESNKPRNARIDTIYNIITAFGITVSDFFSKDAFEENPTQQKTTLPDKPKPGLLKAKSSFDKREFLFEDNLCYAIYDENPVNRGHLLIIPKRLYASYFSSLPEEKQSLWEMVEKAKIFLEREYKPDGYNIGIDEGEVAGQVLPILQIHIIPRYKKDTSNATGGIRRVIPDK